MKPNLVSIDIHGAITDGKSILQKLQKAKEDKNIKGVLLHVNSPGGALAPSVEIATSVKELSRVKPVVAYAAGTMASGSYYSSIWAKKIYANPGAFIGSIGVIFQSYNIKELADKIGIKAQSIKAGKYKEAGTFMRAWTDAEKQSLTTLINDAYAMFVSDVAKARGLRVKDKNLYADAKVFLAKNAQKVGLIDAVGSLQDAQKYLIGVSNVQEPIWQKEDKMDKFLNKLIDESSKSFINLLYGLKAY